MTDILTRQIVQMPVLTAVSPEALAIVQEPDGPMSAISISALLGRLISVGAAKVSRADLYADLVHPAETIGLVYADPNPSYCGWYRKNGASGAGSWVQFERLTMQALDAALAAINTLTDGLTTFNNNATSKTADFNANAAALKADALASISSLPASKANGLLDRIGALAGGRSRVSMFLHPDNAVVTPRAGYGANAIQSVTPAVGPVMTAGPVEYYHPVPQSHTVANGFVPSSGLGGAAYTFITDARNFSINMVIDLPPIRTEYPTLDAMNNFIGTPGDTDRDYVVHTLSPGALVAGGDSGYGQPPLDIYQTLEAGSFLQQGYYRRQSNNYAAFEKFALSLIAGGSSAASGSRFEMAVDMLGRLTNFIYDPAKGAGSASGGAIYDIIAQLGQGPHLVTWHCRDGIQTLVWNGIETASGLSALPLLIDALSTLGSHTVRLMAITNGGSFTQNRLVHDEIAKHYGTRPMDWTPIMDLWVHQDQSRTSRSPGSTVGDPNRPDAFSNWNGELVGRPRTGSGYDAKLGAVTRTPTPGLFSFSSVANAADIGPFGLTTSVHGGTVGRSQSSSSTETIECGIWAQYRKAGYKNGLLILGLTNGGWSHSLLEGRSGNYLHALPEYDANSLFSGPYAAAKDQLNRAVKIAQKWAEARGQRLRLVAVSDLQTETDAYLAGISDVREADMKLWFDNELSHLVDESSPPPVILFKCPSLSGDGYGNTSNTAGSYYVDDKQRLITSHRTGRYRFHTLTCRYAHQGRFIHDSGYSERKLGEEMGYVAFGRGRSFADDTPLQPVSAVRAGANIVITLNRPVKIVDSVAPFVMFRHKTGGFDTFGMVYETASGRTINGNVTLSGDGLTITVPIGGGGGGGGGGAAAGDKIKATGENALWTNFKSLETRLGEYPDQAYPAMPFPQPSPVIADGAPNDISQWLSPFCITLA